MAFRRVGLFAGGLFAGALFAGALFGPQALHRSILPPDGQEEEIDAYTRILLERGRQGLAAYVAKRDAEKRKEQEDRSLSAPQAKAHAGYRIAKNYGELGVFGAGKRVVLTVSPRNNSASAELKKQAALMEEEELAMVLMLMSELS